MTLVLVTGLGRSPGKGNSLPIPVFLPREFHGLYIIHGVAKSQIWLSDFHFQTTTTKTSQATWKKEGILFSQREGLILKHLASRLVFEDEKGCLQEALAAGGFCRELTEGLSRRQRRLSLLVPLLPCTQAQVSLPRPALVPWPWEPGTLASSRLHRRYRPFWKKIRGKCLYHSFPNNPSCPPSRAL